MSLSRRERKELEQTIAKITTENLKAMVGRDRRKHIREVLAAAEKELKKRGVEDATAPQEIKAIPRDENLPSEKTGENQRGEFSGFFLSD